MCYLHVMTPSQPLILGGNDSIVLGPYHTHYPKLEEHLEKVGLQTQPNFWDKPLCVGMLLSLNVKLYGAICHNCSNEFCCLGV